MTRTDIHRRDAAPAGHLSSFVRLSVDEPDAMRRLQRAADGLHGVSRLDAPPSARSVPWCSADADRGQPPGHNPDW